MIGYFKKVFLVNLRFSFWDVISTPLLGGIGSGLTGGFTSGISKLFGGDSGPSQNAKSVHQMRLGSNMGPQPTGQEVAKTSSPMLEPVNVTDQKETKLKEKSWQQKGIDFGLNLAEKSTTRMMEHMTDRLMSGMFEKSASKRAMEDWKYDRIRYPGVTPWEIAGGSPGGSSQGGQAPAEIGASASRTAAGIGAGATTDSAEITSAPLVKKVEYLTGPEADKLRSERDKNVQEMNNMAEQHPYISRLAKADEQLKEAQKSNNVAQANQAKQHAELIRKQVITEVQKAGLTNASKEVQQAYANILKMPRDSNWIANLMLAIGVIAGSGIISGVRGIGKSIIPKKMQRVPGPKGNPPKGGVKKPSAKSKVHVGPRTRGPAAGVSREMHPPGSWRNKDGTFVHPPKRKSSGMTEYRANRGGNVQVQSNSVIDKTKDLSKNPEYWKFNNLDEAVRGMRKKLGRQLNRDEYNKLYNYYMKNKK